MIYFSSFNQKLYDATGKRMLLNFLDRKYHDELYIYTEGEINLDIYDSSIHYIPLDDNVFLKNWLNNNKDIIPKEFGGEFFCKCKLTGPDKHRGHAKDCPGGGMRRRAAHWIKKVASWQETSIRCKYSRCVWIDCDTVFVKRIPEDLINKYLDQCYVRFHRGKRRAQVQSGIESGIVLFDMPNGAANLIKDICDRLSSREKFIHEKRWDDAWMLTVASRDAGILAKGDLCLKSMSSHPVNSGPLSKYIRHDKGIHWKKYGINGY